jgi:hypothetical protein
MFLFAIVATERNVRAPAVLDPTQVQIRRNLRRLEQGDEGEAVRFLRNDLNDVLTRNLEDFSSADRAGVEKIRAKFKERFGETTIAAGGKYDGRTSFLVLALQREFGVTSRGGATEAGSSADVMMRDAIFGVRTARALDTLLGRSPAIPESSFLEALAHRSRAASSSFLSNGSFQTSLKHPRNPFAGVRFTSSLDADLDQYTTSVCDEFGVPKSLVLAIIGRESSGNRFARSPKGAMGLMQLMPDTAARFNVENPFDPKENIRGGVTYLAWLLRHYNGDETLAVAAYNAGERAVDQYSGVPPFSETRNFVVNVLADARALEARAIDKARAAADTQ